MAHPLKVIKVDVCKNLLVDKCFVHLGIFQAENREVIWFQNILSVKSLEIDLEPVLSPWCGSIHWIYIHPDTLHYCFFCNMANYLLSLNRNNPFLNSSSSRMDFTSCWLKKPSNKLAITMPQFPRQLGAIKLKEVFHPMPKCKIICYFCSPWKNPENKILSFINW